MIYKILFNLNYDISMYYNSKMNPLSKTFFYKLIL